MWRIWAKSLGEKVGETDAQADLVAIIRTFWWLVHVATCFMIIIHNGAKLGWWLTQYKEKTYVYNNNTGAMQLL